MFTCHSTIGNFSIVFIPSVAESAGRSRSNIGIHHDVVLQGVAHDRIGNQHENRVRIYSNGIGRSHTGFTTVCCLSHADCIVINCDVTIESFGSFSVHRINCARDNFTVAVPCEDLAAFNTTADVSGECHITAFADSVIAFSKVSGHAVNNRIIVNIDSDGSVVVTSLAGQITVLKQVRNLNNICSGIIRQEGLSQLSHTRNDVVILGAISIPLINQHRIVVVVEMSSKDGLTTLANSSFRSRNINSRFVVNIDFERSTDGGTTVRVGNHHGEGVRIVISRNPSLGIVVVVNTTGNAITLLTVLIPSVVQSGLIVTVHPSNQVDIVITGFLKRSEVAHIVVTGNRHDRITVDMNLVGCNRFRIATFNTEIDEHSINIISGILIKDAELFVECRSINTLQQNAILVPYIGQRRINVVITCGIIMDVSSNIYLFALTNGEIRTVGELLIVSNNLDNLRINNRDGGVTHNGTTRGCLGNFNT